MDPTGLEDDILELAKRCPKKMKNGPCGSSMSGRCEVGGLCIWKEIYDRLDVSDNLPILDKILGAEKFGGDTTPSAVKKHKSFIDKNKFVMTAEIDPPRGTSLAKVDAFLDNIKKSKKISAVNVVDNPLGRPLMSPLLPCIHIMDHKLTPIYQVTCRDRNLSAIQSDIFGAHASGIRDYLFLTGDYSHEHAKPVFDTDAATLAYLAKTKLENSLDFTGKKIDTELHINAGVAVNPSADPLKMELIKFNKKMLYADFAQTQAVFDPKILERFRKETTHIDRTLIGILPITDIRMAEALKKVPGIIIPDDLISAIEKDSAAGIDHAKALIAQSKDLGFRGVHLMTFTNYDILAQLLETPGQ